MSERSSRPHLRPIKHLGQNYLTDDNIARKIVSLVGARPNQTVVEVGPGTGALTKWLHQKYASLHVIEVDTRAVELLRHEFPDVRVHEADVLDIDWTQFGSSIFVVGNLPYYITSEILFSVLDAPKVISQVVFMAQLEVARRLVAETRTKEYGILSVATQLHSVPKIAFRVSRNVFYPRPDVESAVVVLDLTSPMSNNPAELKNARRLSREAFNQRRKTLRNSLSGSVARSGKSLPDEVAGKRAEELTPRDFLELSRYLEA